MPYRVEYRPEARRNLKKLPPEVLRRIISRIENLANNPRPHGVETLTGSERLHRVRVGAYRIVYAVEDKALLVLIVRVGHRREVYRGL